jgi:hypothetical protein
LRAWIRCFADKAPKKLHPNADYLFKPKKEAGILPITLFSLLFLAAQGFYLWLVPKVPPRIHLIGGFGLMLTALASRELPAYGALILISRFLGILAVLKSKMSKGLKKEADWDGFEANGVGLQTVN